MVGLFGGGFIMWRQYNDQTAPQFINSIQHFEEWTKKMKVDVELENHPGTWDGFPDKLAVVRNRKPGQPNPFVVGQQNYIKFLEVMHDCVSLHSIAARTEESRIGRLRPPLVGKLLPKSCWPRPDCVM